VVFVCWTQHIKYSIILFQRLQTIAETSICNYSCRFRPGNFTLDHLQSVRQLL
jgi:hypothetical protein